MLLLPLFYQQARGLPVAEVGWLLAPQGLGLMGGLWVAGRCVDRAGPRIVALAGTVLAGAGLGVFVLAGGTSLVVLSVGLAVLGAGLGGIGVAVSATSYRDVEPASISRATSLLNVAQRIGASFGTVVVALILHQEFAALDANRPSADGIDAAFAHTFAWTLGFLSVAVIIVLALPAGPPPSSKDIQIIEARTTT
jgi:MFS family permease